MIKKIEIQTSNNKLATDIAMLVEQDEFLLEVQRLREKWQITELKKLMLAPPIQELLNIDNIILKGITDRKKQQKRREEFNKDIDEILKTFNRSKNFKPVVEYAIVTGIIPEGIYNSCYFDVVTIKEAGDLSKPEKYQYVIVMSPRTEQKEVVDAYRDFKEYIKKKIQFESRTLPRLEESGNLITSQELQELQELAGFIEYEYDKYKERSKNLSISDEVKEYSKFSEYTQSIRDRAELLLQKIPLDSNNPTDMNLIQQYHTGNIDKNDDIDKHKTLKQFHRNREFFMISYKGILEGTSDKPLTATKVYNEWMKKCPLNGKLKLKDEGRVDCSCQYCTLFEVNTIEKGIDAYIEFLQKLNKTNLNF